MCPIVGIIKHETRARQKYLSDFMASTKNTLFPAASESTNLRAEPHAAALHDTIMCKF